MTTDKKIVKIDNSYYQIKYAKKSMGIGSMAIYKIEENNYIPLSMKLNLWSKLKAFLRNDLWPPSSYTSFFVSDREKLCIIYSELMPFDGFALNSVSHPSEWLAEYNFETKRWNLEKLRFLDESGVPPQE